MPLFTLILIASVAILLLIFLPDLFPYCSSCCKIKPRFMFQVHRSVKFSFGYSGYKSACRACCKRYRIGTLSELKALEHARRKALIEVNK